MRARSLVAVAVVVPVLGCGYGGGGAPAAVVSSLHHAAAQLRLIDRVTAAARTLYTRQVRGSHSLDVLHRVGRDPTLLALLQAHDIAGARAYVARQFPHVWYHWHVSRLRITQGSRVITEVGVPFVVAPSQMVLRGAGGRSVGKLEVSMQDEIGFVRLMRRRFPVQVVVSGRGGSDLRTSMHAAALVRLPAHGSVTLGGHRYMVRSFGEPAWGGELVTIWILARA